MPIMSADQVVSQPVTCLWPLGKRVILDGEARQDWS
jgi:hypothetical protein